MGNMKNGQGGDNTKAAEGTTAQADYSTIAKIMQDVAGQKIWLTRQEDRPLPSTYKERSERYTLQEAIEIAEHYKHDGICFYTGESIFHDGKRLVIFDISTVEPIESLPFGFLRRVPTYIEKTDFGYRALYWLPDAWVTKYYRVAHIWLNLGSEIEILFGPDRSKKPFVSLTFDIQGSPCSIAAPDEAILDDSLGESLKDEERSPEATESITVPFPPPFPGPMADAVNTALNAEFAIQPGLTTLAALIGMAAACGSCYMLPSGGRLNLYGCGVAETGDGKDRPRKLAVMVAREAVAQIIGKPASGQALEDVLVSRLGMLCEIDEIGHLLAAIHGSRAPSYLIEMEGMFLKLFSASDSFYSPRAKAGMKGPPPVIERPAFNLIGFTTVDVLGHAVSVDDVANGSLGRFLFVVGENNPQTRRKADRLALPDSVKVMARRVCLPVKLAMLNNHDDIPITTAPGVDALLDELYRECIRRRQAGTSSFTKALHARSYEKAERVMGVLAVWNNPATPVITPEHIAWAAQAVQSSDAAVLRFAEQHMAKGKVQEHAAQVLDVMTRILEGDLKVKDCASENEALKQGWVPRASVLRHVRKTINARELDEAVRYLDELREIEWGRFATKHPRGHEVFLEVIRPLDEQSQEG